MTRPPSGGLVIYVLFMLVRLLIIRNYPFALLFMIGSCKHQSRHILSFSARARQKSGGGIACA